MGGQLKTVWCLACFLKGVYTLLFVVLFLCVFLFSNKRVRLTSGVFLGFQKTPAAVFRTWPEAMEAPLEVFGGTFGDFFEVSGYCCFVMFCLSLLWSIYGVFFCH